jgi:hypothetical protein
MGKWSKKTNNKSFYNRMEFKNIVCRMCGSCGSYDTDPLFCYDYLYKGGTQQQRKMLIETLMNGEIISIERFDDIFCSKFICSSFVGTTINSAFCRNLSNCYQIVKHQLDGARRPYKTKTYTNKNKYIAEPYITIIVSSKNKIWSEKANGILYGSNDIEQNKNKKCTGCNNKTSG